MTMGDKIVVMKDGVVQQTNTPLNLYHSPLNKFVAGFIGSPAMNFMEGTISKSKRLVFTENGTGVVLELLKEHQAKLRPYLGKEIWLGIRPEHISDAKKSTGIKYSHCKVKIEVVEPMGNEIFVYFTTGNGKQFISRIIATEEPKAGKEMDLMFNMAKVHFFDKETEKVI